MCLLAGSPARANTYTFWTANGDAIGSDGVADKVVFITSADQIEVRITNLQLDISRETQAIASIDFLLKGFATQPQPTKIELQTNLATDPNLGYVVNFPVDKDPTYVATALTTITNRWQIASANTTQLLSGGIQLNVFSGGNPSQLILGQGPYGNVNNALTTHDPYLATNVDDYISFKLTFAAGAGITANTQIDNTAGKRPMVDFGTTFAAGQELILTDQPEPATVAMMLGGLGLIVIGGIRRRKQAAPVESSEPQA